MVRTQDLPQKDPERDQRRIDSVHPERIDRGQCPRHNLLREDVAEWQISVLNKLTPQKTDLLAKPSLVRMMHPWASLPLMGLLPKTIYASEASFAYVILSNGLAEKLRAIRRCDSRCDRSSFVAHLAADTIITWGEGA